MKCCVFITLILTFWGALAAAKEGIREIGVRPGYVDDISVEFDELIEEVHPASDPRQKGELINDYLFNKKLIGEFRGRYEYMFGRTEIERNYSVQNRYTDLEYGPNIRLTPEQDNERRRTYGIFVIRRLSEFHIDQYAQSKEELKKVYEVKKAISNVSVKSKQGFGMNFNYRLSANSFQVKLENPWELKVLFSVHMAGDKIGPTQAKEQQYSVGSNVGKKTRITTYYKQFDGTVTLVGVRKLAKGVSSSITAKSYVKPEGLTAREKALLFGISWAM